VFTARYVLPTQCIYVFLCGSENKQRLFHCTALTDWFYNQDGVCLLHGTNCIREYDVSSSSRHKHWLRAGRSGVRILVGSKRCFSSPKVQRPWGPPSLLLNGYQRSFSEIQQPEHEVSHSPLATAEIRNEWSYTSSPSICPHGVERETLLRHKLARAGNHSGWQIEKQTRLRLAVRRKAAKSTKWTALLSTEFLCYCPWL
jgi:hypothetical protein